VGVDVEGAQVLEVGCVSAWLFSRPFFRTALSHPSLFATQHSAADSLLFHSFYSQLYLASSDKHVVHHLTIQLELLPNWTVLASQRVGDQGGPLTSEFELTEEELDW